MLRRSLRPAAALAVLLLAGNGCLNDSPTGPDPDPAAAPALPSAERLAFDFSFFQEPDRTERASRENFFNAYVRAVVAGAVTHWILTPPVTAFSLALHTVPSPQADGSYLWVYTWVDGEEEAQIRLRGKAEAAGRVLWEMRVSSTEEGFENELWFSGETWDDGEGGEWRFRDFLREGDPEVALLEWGADVAGDFLRFTDLDENPGDSLEYREDGPRKSFTWTDSDAPGESWFVKWNEADGTGSLRAPDYNDGEEACWDEHQRDTVCPPAA